MRKIKTIMVVDDEIDVFNQIRSFLGEDEFNVIKSKNRRDAIEKTNEDTKVDLMLIDTELSIMDKKSLFLFKPNSKYNIDNPDNYLNKPFTKEQLLNFIRLKI